MDRFSREASRIGGASTVVESTENLNVSLYDILYIFQRTQSFKEAEAALTKQENEDEQPPLRPLGHHVSKKAVSPAVAEGGLESTPETLQLLKERIEKFCESLQALRRADRRIPQLGKLSKALEDCQSKVVRYQSLQWPDLCWFDTVVNLSSV